MYKNKIAVLMSTFNGEKYLSQQLDSIINQKDVNVQIVIRDDGSTDSTLKILKDYSSKYNIIKVNNDYKHLGVGRSFMKLLQESEGFDYYSFSDQDDIWYPNKLKIAIDSINLINSKDINVPILYCCNQNCINENEDFMFTRFKNDQMKSNLLRTVYSNYFSGCSMVMNQSLKNIISSSLKMPEMNFFKIRIHDAWVACVAYTTGKVICDENVYIDFRRHKASYSDEFAPNSNINQLRYLINKIKRIRRIGIIKNSVKNTAYNILEFFPEYLSKEDKADLQEINNYKDNMFSKIKFIFSDNFKKNYYGNKLSAYVKIIFGVF